MIPGGGRLGTASLTLGDLIFGHQGLGIADLLKPWAHGEFVAAVLQFI